MYRTVSPVGDVDDACSQTRQHFRVIEVHDPIGVRAILLRKFGFYPFGDEVSQYLKVNGSSWFVCNVEREELDSPFSNPARGIAVVYYVIEWYFGGHHD